MNLSQTAEYALRAMTHLANRGEDDAGMRATDLAEEINVPLAYLQKILRRLVVADLLESRKGHGGGFRLVLAPGEISFEEILGATDSTLPKTSCGFGWNDCDPAHPCPLHPVWSELNESFSRWAEQTTLADVIAAPRGKRRAAGKKRR